jgi:hypothetical protein
MWLNIVAVSGDTNSVAYMDLMASKMTPRQIAQAQNMARDCIANDFKNSH